MLALQVMIFYYHRDCFRFRYLFIIVTFTKQFRPTRIYYYIGGQFPKTFFLQFNRFIENKLNYSRVTFKFKELY